MKTAMILGSDGGIGAALVDQAKNESMYTVSASRSDTVASPNSDLFLTGDFSVPDDLTSMVIHASQEVEAINLWVYAAGDIFSGKAGDIEPGDWKRVFDANLNGAHYALQAFLPLMAEDAHIFFISGYIDRLILPGLSAYAASKAALEVYSSIVQKEQRKKKVALVRLPAVDTKFWEKVPFSTPKGALSPDEVSERIFSAYSQELVGLLDM